jgi:hypothetical protein
LFRFGTQKATQTSAMTVTRQPVELKSLNERLTGVLFLPAGGGEFPAMIVCHGAGAFDLVAAVEIELGTKRNRATFWKPDEYSGCAQLRRSWIGSPTGERVAAPLTRFARELIGVNR